MTFATKTVHAALIAAAGILLPAAGEFPGPFTPATFAPVAATIPDADTAPTMVIADDDVVTTPRPAQLTTLVAQTIDAAPTAYGDRDCLARAVYFESRGEPLEGQLAVAQVILNRVASGRFASTVCAVLAQPGQFSFDRHRVPAEGRDWRTAKAIAAIAATAAWDPVAPKAMAFRAVRVAYTSPTMHRVGTIGNHVFYR